jgi:hypothetical protein
VSEVVVKSVKRYHNLTPRNKIKLEIPRLVNWANQIASNNDMQYGIAMHVNPLDEDIFPRLNSIRKNWQQLWIKIEEGIEVADMILRS